ncbi:MAG: ribonuclease P protein component [Candidatus Binatia bacterium]
MRSRHHQSAPGADRTRGFPRECRLRKRREFLHIQQNYRGRKSAHFITISCPGRSPQARLGITVSRRIGSAVRRNRLKRRVREFFRLHRNQLQPAKDFLIIARAGADNMSYRDVESELMAVLGIGRY